MQRRDFITLFGGTVAAWPLAARAQQDDRVRRMGVLSNNDNPAFLADFAALKQGLAMLGWVESRNLRVEVRLSARDPEEIRADAAALIGLGPNVIFTQGVAATRAVQQQTKNIPIVFVNVGDPLANGIVNNVNRPEGNTTGLTNIFTSVAGKWPELLKEVAPDVARIAVIFNPEFPFSENFLSSIERSANVLSIAAIRTPIRSVTEAQAAIEAFAREPNGGLTIVPPPPSAAIREAILRLAAGYKLPAIYQDKTYSADGGLLSYGSDGNDQWKGAPSYIDRILRGARPSELPVQFPNKFELVVNLKAARAIGLTIPESFLLRADAVIE